MDYRDHNGAMYNQMLPGDLLEVSRGKYSHWAVHVGEGKLVHLWGENDGMGNNASNAIFAASGYNMDKAEVRCDDFWTVVGKDKVTINNTKDRKKRPLPPTEVVANALSKLGEKGYNILYKNCEHFATWCRYGIPWSEQVDTFLSWAAIGVGIGALFMIAMGASRGSSGRKQ